MGSEAALVVTVTATMVGADPVSAIKLGETEHVDCGGAPAQVKATDRLNPPEGETARLKFAVCPAATVADAEEAGAIVKSCPVPLSATVCGLPDALSLIVNVPARVPPTVGSKKTPAAQLAPGATVLPQALRIAKSAELTVIPAMLRGTPPLLVIVTLCGSPEVPAYWAGNVRFEGVTETSGTGMPVPFKLTVSGLSAALSVIAIAAPRPPNPVGANAN
jgi:hypothetical protein